MVALPVSGAKRAVMVEPKCVPSISRPAVSHSVDLLVTRGLIVRSVDPLDRRHVMLDLSAAGNSLMDTVFGDTRQWMMEKFAALTEDEIEALTGSLESLKRII